MSTAPRFLTPTRRRLARTALAALALTAAGCASSSGSTSYAAPTQRSGSGSTFTETLNLDAFREMGFDLRWTGAAVVSRSARVTQANVFGDAVVIQESGHAVSLLQADTGAARWSAVLGNNLTRFVGNARDGDRVFVASDVELFVLNAQTGDLQDKHKLELVVSTPPVVIDGAAFFGSRTGRVLAHDLRTGLSRWQYQLHGGIEAAPVLIGSSVGAVSETGDVIVLNPKTGTATARASVFNGPGGNPAAGDDLIALTCKDQSAYAFSADGGQRLWRYRTESPLTSSLTIIDDIAYFAVPGVGMVGLDAHTGEEIWKATGVSGVAFGHANGNLLVRDRDTIRSIDQRGDTITTITIPGLFDAIMPEGVDGDLYLVTNRGAVSRFNRR